MIGLLHRPGFRVDRLASGESAATWIATMQTFSPPNAELLKVDAGTAVYRSVVTDDQGLPREIVLKAWEVRPGLARLKSMARSSRAWRHWRGASRLLWAGISTARPLALLTERGSRGEVVEWLAMDWLPGRTLLAAVAEIDALSPRRRIGVARAVGSQLAAMDAAALFNRDHKPSNLIVTWPEDVKPNGPLASFATAADEPVISIIDAVAIQRSRDGWRSARRMLASLIIEPTGCGVTISPSTRSRVLSAYIRAQGDLPREARRRALRAGWASVDALVKAHGDPTPRVNPLDSTRG